MSLGRRFLSFGTIELPVVVTDAVTSVAGTSFTANGTLSSIGGGSGNVSVGFYIGTSTNYASNTKYTVSTNASTGAYTYNATGLTSGQAYYINAFAINDGGEVIGSQVTQSTSFVPTFTLMNPSSRYSGSCMPNLALDTQYLDPTTSAYSAISNFQTGNGTASGHAYFNGTAPNILNGCRGFDYPSTSGSNTWSGGSNCAPALRAATNTTTRAYGGTYFLYYCSIVNNTVEIYAPSGYSMSNRVASFYGTPAFGSPTTGSVTVNSNSSSYVMMTISAASGYGTAAAQLEFDL